MNFKDDIVDCTGVQHQIDDEEMRMCHVKDTLRETTQMKEKWYNNNVNKEKPEWELQ